MSLLTSRASALAVLAGAIGMGDGFIGGGTAFTARKAPMPIGPMPKRVRITAGPPKPTTKLLWLIRVCEGGAHGIFQSDVGPIRKPFDAETIEWTPEARQQSAA